MNGFTIQLQLKTIRLVYVGGVSPAYFRASFEEAPTRWHGDGATKTEAIGNLIVAAAKDIGLEVRL